LALPDKAGLAEQIQAAAAPIAKASEYAIERREVQQNNTPEAQKITKDYRGFVVHDDGVSGPITFGHSRLPLWCIINEIVEAGYSAAAEMYPDLPDGGSADQIRWFLHDLLESRKDFARLLCVIPDVER
jgi:hypothetical protein